MDAARSAVCVKENGNVIFFSTVKGTEFTSITVSYLIEVMEYFGCKDAAELDGMGSTQIYENGEEHSLISRKIPNGLLVFPKRVISTAECIR